MKHYSRNNYAHSATHTDAHAERSNAVTKRHTQKSRITEYPAQYSAEGPEVIRVGLRAFTTQESTHMATYRSRYDTRAYKKARAQFKAQGQAENAPCWLCGQPIDYNAPKGNPDAHTLDHLHPVSTAPELHNDPANWRHAHAHCNSKRGNRPVTKQNTVLPCWWRQG